MDDKNKQQEQFKNWIYDLYIANSSGDKKKIKAILKDIDKRLSVIDNE